MLDFRSYRVVSVWPRTERNGAGLTFPASDQNKRTAVQLFRRFAAPLMLPSFTSPFKRDVIIQITAFHHAFQSHSRSAGCLLVVCHHPPALEAVLESQHRSWLMTAERHAIVEPARQVQLSRSSPTGANGTLSILEGLQVAL